MSHYGRFTQIDLADLSFLSSRMQDPSQLNREASRFALELAALSYDFQVSPWLDAGWTDISIQADERLLGGVGVTQLADRPLYQRMVNEFVPVAARRVIKSNHNIKQIAGMLWKPTPSTRTGKAISMIHPLENGRFVVAIGFMGTGKRRMDWEVNFRLSHPENFHQGFLDTAIQFEENSEKINFDQTAALLDIPALTLKDVLEEASKPNSRFTIFATGHSQGAAVLQVWVWRQMQKGLLRENVLGYGFASPSVTSLSADKIKNYPIFHFSNSDDAFSKIGLFRHIGKGYIYHADDEFRAFCYQGHETDEVFMKLISWFNKFEGTQDAISFSLAYLQALSVLPVEDIQASLAIMGGTNRAERFLLNQDEPVYGILRFMNRLLLSNYKSAMKKLPDEHYISDMADSLQQQIEYAGAERFARTIFQVLGVPHTLVFRDIATPGLAPYHYMVIRGFGEMREED
ncbi:MAG: hypothetical protein GX781_08225 [Clostridiales bacterium]|nr:hypothetical protein [Clostridiales bacterium]